MTNIAIPNQVAIKYDQRPFCNANSICANRSGDQSRRWLKKSSLRVKTRIVTSWSLVCWQTTRTSSSYAPRAIRYHVVSSNCRNSLISSAVLATAFLAARTAGRMSAENVRATPSLSGSERNPHGGACRHGKPNRNEQEHSHNGLLGKASCRWSTAKSRPCGRGEKPLF